MKSNTKQNICRACLTEEGLFQSVFQRKRSSGVSMNISEMLSACATIQVNEGDGLPDQICLQCSEQTVKMYLFKIKCEKNNIILRKRFKKRKAKSVAIKNKCDNIALNKNINKDFQNDEFKCEIDEEMWEKKHAKISYEALKEESEIKEFESDICKENNNEIDLLTNQEIVEDIKVEKIEILDEHISDLHIKKEPEVFCDEDLKRKQQLAEINSLLENQPRRCDVCFEGFNQKSELKKHIKTHISTSKQTGEKSTISDVVCKKEFRKSYECDICEKKFTKSSNLSCHRKIHTGEKPHKCNLCKKRFIQLDHLIKHKRIHTGEKPYECDVCKKKFSQKNTLVAHKRVHTGEKPYECDVCQKKFVQLGHLTTHKTIHTGEKPLKCEICNRKFIYFSVLMIHKRIHTGEKPYECNVCQMKFSKAGNLKRHKTTHNI